VRLNVFIFEILKDQQISYTMERTFREAFQGFAKDTLNILGRNPALAELPIAVRYSYSTSGTRN
jgi:hypothetical protein